ncbi:MAG: class I SAM-dependent methyltransferase [Deltaproteobacteria bacterium]|nr:class I SAM-dependent methyltransferase [Deltaproteobacteria bacterium]
MELNILWPAIAAIALLILVKMVYVFSMVIALPRTGGALFCFTHSSKIDAVLDAIPMKKGDKIVDLGCGDGRFLAAAAGRYGVTGRGYDINFLALFMARVRLLFGPAGVLVSRKDFFNVYLGDSDIIFCYLFPDVMEKLALKVDREMKEGALLISCNFPLPGWFPESVITADHRVQKDPVYVYRKK